MSKESLSAATPTEVIFSLTDLGAAISIARKSRGDTQAQAAQRCGVHPQTIARIEQGDPSVAIGKVFSLLAAYGMSRRLFDLSVMDESTTILLKRQIKRPRKKS